MNQDLGGQEDSTLDVHVQPCLADTSDARVCKETVFEPRFIDELASWVKNDRKIALRVFSFIEEISRNAYEGTGKPERLKYKSDNVWSRRINHADRIVYRVKDSKIYFLSCRYHYDDH